MWIIALCSINGKLKFFGSDSAQRKVVIDNKPVVYLSGCVKFA